VRSRQLPRFERGCAEVSAAIIAEASFADHRRDRTPGEPRFARARISRRRSPACRLHGWLAGDLMHDIDTTVAEFESPHDELGLEFESGWSPEQALPGEASDSELAAELLSISSEAELESFFGKLISNAGQRVGHFVQSDTGRALGGILKKAAMHALPILGRVAGNLIAPGIGGAIGGRLAADAGHLFGLELEGLSSEERDTEVARAIVEFASEAALEAAQTDDRGAPPEQVATQAAAAAAERTAPGLLAGGGAPGRAPRRHPHHGRWVRRGRNIVLLGVF
jgi:hypothetical protein